MEGTVKWFDTQKGYGFINGDDGKDYFVHHSQLPGDGVNDNDRVSFDPTTTDRGLQASNVRLI